MGTYSGLAGGMPVAANVASNTIDPLDPVVSGGDSFDLDELRTHPLVLSGSIDLDDIRYVRLQDVAEGTLADRQGRWIWDHGGATGSADIDAIAEFNAIYQRWHQGEVDVPMPGGENARDVLDRYLPVITDLRLRYLDNEDWTSDIVVVSHGAAIRLTAATLAGVDSSFVLDHHLANAESVVLAPITDGRWSCLRWGAKTPPFYPEPDVHPVEDALESPDPMG